MAKIVRKNQKVFCDVAPTGKLGKFGSFAAGTAEYSNDVETIQSLAAYGSGLSGALINNAPPAIQDIDGLSYMITKQLAYLFQSGVPEYSSLTTYYIGSLVSVSGQIFMSVTDDNLGNNVSDQANWVIYKSNKVTRYTGDIAMVAYDDYIVELDGSTAGGATTILFILPTPTAAMAGRIIIVKNLYPTASGSIQIQVEDSSTIDGNDFVNLTTQYLTGRFICNGTKWDKIY